MQTKTSWWHRRDFFTCENKWMNRTYSSFYGFYFQYKTRIRKSLSTSVFVYIFFSPKKLDLILNSLQNASNIFLAIKEHIYFVEFYTLIILNECCCCWFFFVVSFRLVHLCDFTVNRIPCCRLCRCRAHWLWK